MILLEFSGDAHGENYRFPDTLTLPLSSTAERSLSLELIGGIIHSPEHWYTAVKDSNDWLVIDMAEETPHRKLRTTTDTKRPKKFRFALYRASNSSMHEHNIVMPEELQTSNAAAQTLRE